MKVIVAFELDSTWEAEYADCSDEIIFDDLENDGFVSGVESATLIGIER